MNTVIEAIYEGGQLRLLQPLALPEQTHVRLSVELVPAHTGVQPHRFASEDLIGSYGLGGGSATNERVREAMRRRVIPTA